MAESRHVAVKLGCPLLGVKRTWLRNDALSASDPKRRERGAFAAMQDPDLLYSIRDPCPWGKAHEAARFHLPSGEEIRKMLDHDRQEAKSDLETSVRALRIEIARLARLPAATAFTLKSR